MEEADILRLVLGELRKEDSVGVRLAIVVVLAVAGQTAQVNTLVLLVPIVDGKHNVALLDTPRVGQSSDERAVDHIPELAVVLLLLVDDRVEYCATFTYGKRAELGEDVGLGHAIFVARVLDLRHDLFGQIFVFVLEVERVLDREATADIQAIQIGANLLQLAVDADTLAQLIPIVGRILDTCIDEEVEHFELELLVVFDLLLVEIDDVVVANTQTRGIEVELRLLLRCNADTHLAALFDYVGEQVDLLLVVDHGNRVDESRIDQRSDVLDILRTLEAVTNDVAILVDHAAIVQSLNDMDIVCRRSFEVNIVFQSLFEHEREVRRLGAVAVVVATLVVHLSHCYIEQTLGAIDLR